MGMFSMRETREGVNVRETKEKDPRLEKALESLWGPKLCTKCNGLRNAELALRHGKCTSLEYVIIPHCTC